MRIEVGQEIEGVNSLLTSNPSSTMHEKEDVFWCLHQARTNDVLVLFTEN